MKCFSILALVGFETMPLGSQWVIVWLLALSLNNVVEGSIPPHGNEAHFMTSRRTTEARGLIITTGDGYPSYDHKGT